MSPMRSRTRHGVRRGRIASRTPATRLGGDGTGNGGTIYDPHGAARTLGLRITEAMDPMRAPGPVRSFADMTDAEKAEMERLYGERR